MNFIEFEKGIEVRIMPRKAKPVDIATVRISNKQKEARREQEQKLKGNNDKLEAPAYLNSRQKEIFNNVRDELMQFIGNVTWMEQMIKICGL